MAATTNKLSGLHELLATAMGDALDAEQARIAVTKRILETDLEELDEGAAKHLSLVLSLAPTARVDNGLLKTISAFLKDNNITSDLENEGEADEKLAKLKELKAKRTVAATPVDFIQ